jgi:hypothetical protein
MSVRSLTYSPYERAHIGDDPPRIIPAGGRFLNG